jgi:hypothetical protein
MATEPVLPSLPAEARTALDALAALHAGAAGRPHLDALYVHSDEIGKAAQADGPGIPHTVDGVFHRAGLHPDPVLWATLDRHGLTAYGTPASRTGLRAVIWPI